MQSILAWQTGDELMYKCRVKNPDAANHAFFLPTAVTRVTFAYCLTSNKLVLDTESVFPTVKDIRKAFLS